MTYLSCTLYYIRIFIFVLKIYIIPYNSKFECKIIFYVLLFIIFMYFLRKQQNANINYSAKIEYMFIKYIVLNITIIYENDSRKP